MSVCPGIISIHQSHKSQGSAAAASQQTAATQRLAAMNQWEQNGIFFISLLLFLRRSSSVFPRRNNWRGSPSRGKQLIYILPHKHTVTLGFFAPAPQTRQKRLLSQRNLPSVLLQLSAAGRQPSPGWKTKTFFPIALRPKCIVGALPVGHGFWRSLITHHGPLLFCRKQPPRWARARCTSRGPNVFYF